MPADADPMRAEVTRAEVARADAARDRASAGRLAQGRDGAPARCPAVLVSGPASGQGKTTVGAALARLHTRRGRRVRMFKCGTDFIDPGWHALASGAPAHPLDLWVNGEADCRARLHRAAAEADLIVVEGAMGLFDGAPDTASLARAFDLPVLAVIDASAMAGTFGALVHGLVHYRDGLRWAGVLANRVAGAAHAQMLRASLRDGCAWLGALPPAPALALPERHLGLVLPEDLDDARLRVDAAADALARTPLGAIDDAALARWSVDFPAAARAPRVPRLLAQRTIAVARDAAFCFVHDANLDTLRALGATLAFFSPLAGDMLPRCDAVWLPGGYPELHAPALAARRALGAELAAHVAAGRPVWAECGGMMALFDRLVDIDGRAHPMWGLLPGTVEMRPGLAAIGPQQLRFGGGTLRGHAFHHSRCTTPLAPAAHTSAPGRPERPSPGEALYVRGPVRASYFHPWFASSPRSAARLFLPADPV